MKRTITLVAIICLLSLFTAGQSPKLRQRCSAGTCMLQINGVSKTANRFDRRYQLTYFYSQNTSSSAQLVLRVELIQRVRRAESFGALIYVAVDALPETERTGTAQLVEMNAESYAIETLLTKDELQRIAAAKQSAMITLDGIAITVQGEDLAAWRAMSDKLAAP